MPTLYPLQADAVERFANGPEGPKRLILGWSTGCGKTAGALTVVSRYYTPERHRILIVTPAIVRRHWLREVAKWAPRWRPYAACVEYGRKRKLPAVITDRRDLAYTSALQVVSYDLLRDIDAQRWDLIILDELHHLAAPRSKQSRLVQSLFTANPAADALGLTATPFPTEVAQVWNPLRLLFGEDVWGRPTRTGDVSWDFAARYCEIERSEWGSRICGSRADRRSELHTRLQSYIHFLTRDQLRADLPPLDVSLTDLGPGDMCGNIAQWVKEKLAEGVRRVVVLTHYRSTAQEVCSQVGEYLTGGEVVVSMDGTTAVAVRDTELERVASADGPGILIGTYGSLAEGVRLMWADSVLVAQWPQSPGQLVQILGRFQSVGSDAVPQVSLLTTDQSYSSSAVLLERVQALSEIVGPSPTARKLESILTRQKIAAPGLAALMEDMLADIRSDAWMEESV